MYNFDHIGDIPCEELQFQISDQLFFEVLLMKIRGETISYASHKKKIDFEKEERLLTEINRIEENVTDSNVAELEDLKAQLQEIRNKKVEGIAIRSRVRWLQEGEKPTRYFCNLENRNFIDKTMPFIERDDGVIIYNQTEILSEVQTYYKSLYRYKNISNVSLEECLLDAPKLSDLDSKSIEGVITVSEAAAALKRMKKQ